MTTLTYPETAISEAKKSNIVEEDIVVAKDFSVYYGNFHAVKSVSMGFVRKKVTAIIGPSGCGKSTFLRCPKSIYDNVAYGVRVKGRCPKNELDEIVESSLRKAALWDEVKDRLQQNAMGMSGGQQQRLCIARALAIKPEVLLMDEPCSALDPKSTSRIEDLIGELSGEYTIAIVTHNMQQASRVSDYTAFFYEGNLIEFGATKDIFTHPKQKSTNDYITGRFG